MDRMDKTKIVARNYDWNCDPPLCVAVPRFRAVDMWSDKRADWCPLIEVKRPAYDAQLLRDCGMEE